MTNQAGNNFASSISQTSAAWISTLTLLSRLVESMFLVSPSLTLPCKFYIRPRFVCDQLFFKHHTFFLGKATCSLSFWSALSIVFLCCSWRCCCYCCLCCPCCCCNDWHGLCQRATLVMTSTRAAFHGKALCEGRRTPPLTFPCLHLAANSAASSYSKLRADKLQSW